MVNERSQGGGVGGDDRQANGHGFQEGQAKRLPVRRRNEEVAAAEELGYVEAPAKKYDTVSVDLEEVDTAADSFTLGALADEQEINVVVVGKDLGGGGDENVVALYPTQIGNSGD